MSETKMLSVVGLDGLRGTVAELPAGGLVELCLASGPRVRVAADLFTRRDDGTLFVPLRPDDLTGRHAQSTQAAAAPSPDSLVIPVYEEKVRVGTERVPGEMVTVHITPKVRTEQVEAALADERVEVSRVPVDRWVERVEPPSQQGDVMIVPVYEEVLVVEKRLRLKEEIHLQRVRTTRAEQHAIELQSEDVQVVRSHPPRLEPAAPGNEPAPVRQA